MNHYQTTPKQVRKDPSPLTSFQISPKHQRYREPVKKRINKVTSFSNNIQFIHVLSNYTQKLILLLLFIHPETMPTVSWHQEFNSLREESSVYSLILGTVPSSYSFLLEETCFLLLLSKVSQLSAAADSMPPDTHNVPIIMCHTHTRSVFPACMSADYSLCHRHVRFLFCSEGHIWFLQTWRRLISRLLCDRGWERFNNKVLRRQCLFCG
jgi:hypothetical protein